jgi:hypothetical protein
MKISINNSQLAELQHYLRVAVEDNFPMTGIALSLGAKQIQSVWQDYALGKKELPGVPALKNPSGKYAQSIHTKPIGEFRHEIYSEAKIADWIENGTDKIDMKETHTKGPRSRRSKDGVPYVIIPFRWGTPGTKKNPRVGFGNNVLTAGVYRRLLKESFRASSVTVSPNKSDYKTPNAKGEMVGRAQHQWGSRLRGRDFAGTIEQKTRMNGMVRFENGYDNEGNISKRYGGYFTFRVISKNSPKDSWIKPATPARHVTRGVQEDTKKEITEMIDEALKADIKLLSKGVKNV